jgi:hypothetical protein
MIRMMLTVMRVLCGPQTPQDAPSLGADRTTDPSQWLQVCGCTQARIARVTLNRWCGPTAAHRAVRERAVGCVTQKHGA